MLAVAGRRAGGGGRRRVELRNRTTSGAASDATRAAGTGLRPGTLSALRTSALQGCTFEVGLG